MASSPPAPTTSSYAVLGLLAVKPMNAYELTVQARRSLHWVWPRSERSIYTEPKRLVSLGWAKAKDRRTGQRITPEYHVTPAGRRALRAWLATPPSAPATDIEAMLRVIFADQGTKEDLRQALESNREQLRRALATNALDQCRAYLEDGGPFPRRLHLIGLFSDFYLRFETLIEDWTIEALAEIETWPDTADVGMTEGARRTFERAVAHLAQVEGFAAVDDRR